MYRKGYTYWSIDRDHLLNGGGTISAEGGQYLLADYVRGGQFPLADYVRGDKICGGTESAPTPDQFTNNKSVSSAPFTRPYIPYKLSRARGLYPYITELTELIALRFLVPQYGAMTLRVALRETGSCRSFFLVPPLVFEM